MPKFAIRNSKSRHPKFNYLFYIDFFMRSLYLCTVCGVKWTVSIHTEPRDHSNIVKSIYVFVLLSLAVLLGLARADDSTDTPGKASVGAASSGPDQGSPGSVSRPWHRFTHKIRDGETFASILRPLGVSGAESHYWFKAVNKRLPKGRLTSSQTLYLYFEETPALNKTGNLRAIQIESKASHIFSWTLAHQRIAFSQRKALFNEADTAAIPPAKGATQHRVSELPTKTQAITVASQPEAAPAAGLASVEHLTHVVRRGETLAKIFKRMSVPTREAHRWFRAVARNYSVKRLRPGRRMVFYFTTAIAPNAASRGKQTLRGLQIETSRGKLLTWQKEGQRIAYRGKNHDLAKVHAAALESRPLNGVSKPAGQTSKRINGVRVNGVNDHAKVPAPPALESLHRVTRQLAKGETFAAIVKPLGVSGVESQTWFLALQKNRSARNLTSGQRIQFYFEEVPAKDRTGNLRAVRLTSKQGKTLTWRLVDDHIYFGSKKVLALRASRPNESPRIVMGSYPGGLRKFPLSQYTLARVKQRNGLSAHTAPSTGHRPVASLEALERITTKIKPGETLLGLLRPYGLNKEDEQEWLSSIQRNYIAKKLQPGSTVQVYFANQGNTDEENDPPVIGQLKAFEIELPGDQILTWYRSEHGIIFYKSEPPFDVEVKAVSGKVTTGSLYAAAARVGLHPAVISQLVDIFGWDINFETDLRKGDTFRILYKRKFRPGSKQASKIRVLAAEITNRGRRHMAIYFENANGTGHYYDVDGRTVSRSFLRYPVEFRRISSSFSRRRYHPILRVRRPHRGVDFAAKRRTPVRTVGSGLVTYAAWKGAYGRFIEIDHGEGLKTRYAHLHRIARGVRPGARVYKGQVIASVGCSGRCTGPHLHFEMWRNNHYVNPLKTDLPPDDELDPTVFRIFEEAKASFLAKLTEER